VLLSRHGIDVEVDRRALYTPEDLYRANLGGSPDNFGLPFRYGALGDEARIGDAQAILFWGDFLHSRHYRNAVAQLIARCGIADSSRSLQHVDRHLFLCDEPAEVLHRCVLFGEALLIDADQAQPGDDYERNLQRLLENAHAVWMRDVLSAQRAADMRGTPTASHCGIDCALLLTPEDCDSLAGKVEGPRRGVGIFFARTRDDPAVLLEFARQLSRRLGLLAEWVPWFSAGAIPPDILRAHWPDLTVPPPVDTVGSALRAMLSHEVIITDAYHLCALAWGNGIPAVCIGRGASRFFTSVSDKKKELFLQTISAERFYVFSEHLPLLGRSSADAQAFAWPPDVAPPSLDSLADAVHDRALTAAIKERINRQREAAEHELVAALLHLVPVAPPRPAGQP
jgi:hypothetical protein